jgi:hypothetical protein
MREKIPWNSIEDFSQYGKRMNFIAHWPLTRNGNDF